MDKATSALVPTAHAVSSRHDILFTIKSTSFFIAPPILNESFARSTYRLLPRNMTSNRKAEVVARESNPVVQVSAVKANWL